MQHGRVLSKPMKLCMTQVKLRYKICEDNGGKAAHAVHQTTVLQPRCLHHAGF